ncbi:MAG: histidinol-phosphate transaminase [Acidobacteria bacterium]|nr:histidinol-phosphate transaminase [Acidobacteriota bacterium]
MTTKKPPSPLVPSYISRIQPYIPGKPIEEVERELGLVAIKLASNENPLGPSPKAMEAVVKHVGQSHRYPDAGGYYLREKLAARHNVEMNRLVLGAGSTELIQLLCHTYLGPGLAGLTSEGSFVVFPISVGFTGAEPLLVPLKDYAYDLDALAARLDERVRLLYLANPNNPTGTLFTAAEMDRFLERVPENVLVILDEAYCDYVERPDYSRSLDYVRAGRYLVVLRTFSKIHGLAGLRVGYGIGHRDVIDSINKIRSPFNVSSLAQVAALAALEDAEHVARSVESNRRGLAFLTRELTRLGLKVVPSVTNFLYVETGGEAREDFRALLQMGVIVRPLDFMDMPASLRVTVGTVEENQRVVEAFAKRMAALEPGRQRARA